MKFFSKYTSSSSSGGGSGSRRGLRDARVMTVVLFVVLLSGSLPSPARAQVRNTLSAWISRSCLPQSEDEFYPNPGTVFPSAEHRVDEFRSVGSTSTSPSPDSLFAAARKALGTAFDAPVLSPILQANYSGTTLASVVAASLRRLELSSLYACSSNPDAFLFGVSSSSSAAYGKALIEVKMLYTAQQAGLALELYRVDLSSSVARLELLGRSQTESATDPEPLDYDLERITRLVPVASASNDADFGASFFMAKVLVTNASSSRYSLSVEVVDAEQACGSAGLAIVRASQPDALTDPRSKSVVTVSGNLNAELLLANLSACEYAELEFPLGWPSAQATETLFIQNVPVTPFRYQMHVASRDSTITLTRGSSTLASLDYLNAEGEALIASAPHNTASSPYVARIEPSGTGTDRLRVAKFWYALCPAVSPSLVTLSAPSVGSSLTANSTLCGDGQAGAEFEVDVSSITANSSWMLAIEATRQSSTGHLISSLAISALVFDINNTLIRNLSSIDVQSPNAVLFSYDQLDLAAKIKVKVWRQPWFILKYGSSTASSAMTPPEPLISLVVRSESAIPHVDTPSPNCSAVVHVSPGGMVQTFVCANSVRTVRIGRLPKSSLQYKNGVDMTVLVNITSGYSSLAKDTELITFISSSHLGALFPSGQNVFHGSIESFLPSFLFNPFGVVEPSASGTEVLDIQLINTNGFPVQFELTTDWWECAPDSLPNDLSTYVNATSSLLELKASPTTGLVDSQLPVAEICRDEFDYYRLNTSDADLVEIRAEFCAFALVSSADYRSGCFFPRAVVAETNSLSTGVGFRVERISSKVVLFESSDFFGADLSFGRSQTLKVVPSLAGDLALRVSNVISSSGRYGVSAAWRKFSQTLTGGQIFPREIYPPPPSAEATVSSSSVPILAGTALYVLIAFAILLCILIAVIAVVVFRKRARNSTQEEVTMDEVTVDAFYPAEAKDGLAETPKKKKKKSAPTLDNVVLQDVIGKGHFGSVYRADWSGTPVAAKTTTNVDEIAAELKVLSKIDHPNVVHFLGIATIKVEKNESESSVHDGFGSTENSSNEDSELGEGMVNFMVFELCDGSVFSLISKIEIGMQQKLSFLRDSARGLAYIHSMNIIHRDIACRNLLYRGSTALLSDFGLSRKFNDDQYFKMDESAAAMPIRWTAPEVLKQHKANVGSDCYSFGIMAWELLMNGEVPMLALTGKQLIAAITEGRQAEILVAPTDCPDELYDLMKSVWQPNWHDRPKTSDILHILDGIVAESSTAGHSTPATPRTPRTPQTPGQLGQYSAWDVASPLRSALPKVRSRQASMGASSAGPSTNDFEDNYTLQWDGVVSESSGEAPRRKTSQPMAADDNYTLQVPEESMLGDIVMGDDGYGGFDFPVPEKKTKKHTSASRPKGSGRSDDILIGDDGYGGFDFPVPEKKKKKKKKRSLPTTVAEE